MIVGTAGHIDHGKTTLVRALTGVDTDRLKEEKERGISIELGYAYAPSDQGAVLGFVDVPGHERLVHTMAAGASGIDFALLVVAADDGVMPQTREHAVILEMFGVARGAVALTKIDRVDEARIASVESEINRLLSTTSLRGAPVFRLNALTGLGVSEIRRHLEVEAANSPSADRSVDSREKLFRLAVDRVFTLPGHGTVVAGTVFSGSVRTGDTVVVLPSNTPARIRSIHAHNRPADVGLAGERCALNLAGIEKHAIRRGDWVADSRMLVPTTRIDVRLQLLEGSNRVLKSWSAVHFHHGAAHVTAHVIPLERPVISPGESSYAQVVLEEPICSLPGDRFIVRDAQAMHTLGGGRVLDPSAPSRKRRSAERMHVLGAIESLIAGDGLRPLLSESPHGIKHADLVHLTGCVNENVRIPDDAIVVNGARGRHVLLVATWRSLREQTLAALRRFHAEVPDEPGPDIGRLRRIAHPQISQDLWEALIGELAHDGALVRSDPWVHLPDHVVALTEGETALAGRLQPLIAAGRFNPPWVRDLARVTTSPEESVRSVLRKQVTRGALFQVVHDLFYDRGCVTELAELITRLAIEHGSVEAAQYRDVVGVGRKRAIQILEFFDRVGHTRRTGDSRVLRVDSTWRKA